MVMMTTMMMMMMMTMMMRMPRLIDSTEPESLALSLLLHSLLRLRLWCCLRAPLQTSSATP
eukprot:7664289-Karenia_brevis.AAC.1